MTRTLLSMTRVWGYVELASWGGGSVWFSPTLSFNTPHMDICSLVTILCYVSMFGNFLGPWWTFSPSLSSVCTGFKDYVKQPCNFSGNTPFGKRKRGASVSSTNSGHFRRLLDSFRRLSSRSADTTIDTGVNISRTEDAWVCNCQIDMYPRNTATSQGWTDHGPSSLTPPSSRWSCCPSW